MNVAKIGAWPGLLSLDLAAMYCSMKPRDFLKAVAVGDLPDPVIINGQERWRLADIEGMFTEKRDQWQMSA